MKLNTTQFKYSFVMAFVVLSLCVNAQINNINKVGGQPIMVQKYAKVEGTPYIGGGEWFTGKFTIKDGQTYDNMLIRYNGYEDNLEFQREGKSPLIIDNKILNSFEFRKLNEERTKTEVYTFKVGRLIEGKDINEDGFYRIIYEGDFKIYQKMKVGQVTITPPDYGQSDFQKFVFSNDFLFIDKTGKIDDFKLNRGNFYSKFSGNKKDIKEYLKTKNVDFDDATDVAQLSAYIETL